ncbi:MAG: AraC family transcriptional regulator [Ferruginibacter sp.]
MTVSNTLHPVDKEYIFKQVNYVKWVEDFATMLDCVTRNNCIVFNSGLGKGISKGFSLESGFSACVNNYTLNIDHSFTRLPTDQFGVIIYIYHFHSEEVIKYSLDEQAMDFGFGSHYALRITNAQTMHRIKFSKNATVMGISIFLEKEWLDNNTNEKTRDLLNYLKQVNYFEQLLNAKQKKLLDEIVNMPESHPYPAIFVKSRIYRLLDKLLENFVLKEFTQKAENISDDDFQMLQRIETILTLSFDEGFPGVEKLSRISLMSESKLKKLFKQSFGMGLYEYFQKNRMHRAKEYILSGNYTISEVGIKLGYLNLSNFSTAFRKEFQCLPSEIAIPQL